MRMRLAVALAVASASCASETESLSDGGSAADVEEQQPDASDADTGEEPDGGEPPRTECLFPSGCVCPVGVSCGADNGCNWCTCDPSNGALRCTAVACTSPSFRAICDVDNPCPQGQCIFDQGACGPGSGRCVVAQCASEPLELCRCDGSTFFSGGCPREPFAHAGPC